jgi:glycosyltransferase involved in cell wall biosynthesis
MEGQRGRKKILYVITKSNWGGAQRYTYDLATTLPREEFDVAVAAGGQGALKENLKQTGVEVHDLPIQNDLSIGNALASIRFLLKLLKIRRPDILHINSSKAGIVAGIAGRLAGIKLIIFTSHGWAFLEDRIFPIRLVLWFAQWTTLLLSHKVIAVSDHIKTSAPSFLISKGKISVVRNGIERFELLDKKAARERLLGNKSDKYIKYTWIGTISELHPNKGLQYAVRAMKELPYAIFIVIGEGTDRKKLEEDIANLNLSSKVFLVGYKDYAARLLSAFDVFTLTSTTEALGYVLLEAGLAGLPVVASRVGGIPEIIEDGKTGLLVKPRDTEGMRDAILTLMQDREMGERLGTALKKKVEQEFSLTQMVDKTMKLYQKAS